jgi:hypothetical protein
VVEPTLAGGNPDLVGWFSIMTIRDYGRESAPRGKRYWKKAACSFALWSLVRV